MAPVIIKTNYSESRIRRLKEERTENLRGSNSKIVIAHKKKSRAAAKMKRGKNR